MTVYSKFALGKRTDPAVFTQAGTPTTIVALFNGGTQPETVYLEGLFTYPYRSSTIDGTTWTVRRQGGWPSDFLLGVDDTQATGNTLLGPLTSSLSARAGTSGELVLTSGRVRLNDNGDAPWDYKAAPFVESPLTDARINAPGNAGQYRLRHNGAWYARWSGVVGDGVRVSDAVVTGGNPIVTSPSNGFASARVGQLVTVTTPSEPCTGTVTGTAGSRFVTGAGTSFLDEVRDKAWGTTGNGQTLWIQGQIYVVFRFFSQTSIELDRPLHANAPGVAAYREQQLPTTIAAVNLDITGAVESITLAATPVVSGTGVKALFGTDSKSALISAVATAKALGITLLVLPPGLVCVSGNSMFTGVTDLVIAGSGMDGTTICDLQRASAEIGYLNEDQALLTFKDCQRVFIRDFGIDGGVPVWGFQHSSGGGFNANGGRCGVMFRSGDSCGFANIKGAGYATRDEFFCVIGDATNFRGTNLYAPQANNIGLNINTSNLCKGLQISNVFIKSHYSPYLGGSGNGNVSDMILEMREDAYSGASLFVSDSSSSITYSNITLRGHNSPYSSVSVVELFGDNGTAANLQLNGFRIENCNGYYITGLVRIHEVAAGSLIKLRGWTIKDCTSGARGSSFVHIDGGTAEVISYDDIDVSCAEDCNISFECVVTSSTAANVVPVPTRFQHGRTGPIRNTANHRITGPLADLLSTQAWRAFFEADHYSVDAVSGKVSKFHDRLNYARYLQQTTSANQVAVPTAEPLLNNAMAAHFLGSQRYTSNEALAWWLGLHGNNSFVVAVWVPDSVAAATHQFVCGTGSNNYTERGISITQYGATQASYMFGNGPSDIVVYMLPTTAFAVGTPKALVVEQSGNAARMRAGTPSGGLLTFPTVASDTAFANAISVSDPVYNLSLGATSGPVIANGLTGRWAMLAIRDAPLDATGLGYLGAYILAKYGNGF
jgi:hypothetical protein